MRHAWLARSLIAACGGCSAAASACRLAKSRLSEIQDPNAEHDAFMPADVIADLEAYCGRPIYSTALGEIAPADDVPAVNVIEESCELTEVACALQRLMRTAKVKAFMFARREREAILRDLDLVEAHARLVRAAVQS